MKNLFLLMSVCLILLLSGLFFFNSPRAQNLLSEKQSNSFESLLDEARANGFVDVVVNLNGDLKAESDLSEVEIKNRRAEIERLQNEFLNRLNPFQFEVVKRFKHIPYLQMKISPDALETLRADANIALRKTEPLSAAQNQTLAASEQDKIGNLSSILDSETGAAKSGIVQSRRTKIPVMQKPPNEAPEGEEEENARQPIYSNDDAPGDAATAPNPPSSPSELPNNSGKGKTPAAATDMTAFRSHDLTSAEAPTNSRSSIHEPSVVNDGNAVFYTANWYAARSLDGGQTFSYVNPYTSFPASGGGFCCDQLTAYAPAQDMIVWGLQYGDGSATNVFRIARTIGAAGLASNQWTYYDFTPANFNLPSGQWMDFPNMTVSGSDLYATSNLYTVSGGNFAGSVVFRIPLAQLAAGGSVNFNYITFTDIGSLRLTEGAGGTMHWVANTFSGSTLRLYHWADSSNSYTTQTVAVNSFNPLNRDGVAASADGTNWTARADSRVLAGYVSNGVIGAMWGAKQGGQFPYPYTIHARFSESTGALISQNVVWNPNYAWLYPTVSVNAAGNLGGAISFGGGTASPSFPNTAIWALDDVTTTLPLGGIYTATTSSAGTSRNCWGDYLSVKPNKLFPNTWVGAMYYMNGGTDNSNSVPRYLWFGRERDGQPAATKRFFDFDGDGRADVSVFRPSNGVWYLNRSRDGYTGYQFGTATDKIVPADYDGDGKTDVAVYRGGSWFVLKSSNLTFASYTFGLSNDVPTPADFDGDGRVELAVFRNSDATWYELNTTTNAFTSAGFGASGDKPVAADYDGDGKADVAVYRPSNGVWYIQRSRDGYTGYQFGISSDKPVPADYDGDGKTDVAVYRASEGNWYILKTSTGFASTQFGLSSDTPAPADYDGDGRADIAVFRIDGGGAGNWYQLKSSEGFGAVLFGSNGDKPTPNAFVP